MIFLFGLFCDHNTWTNPVLFFCNVCSQMFALQCTANNKHLPSRYVTSFGIQTTLCNIEMTKGFICARVLFLLYRMCVYGCLADITHSVTKLCIHIYTFDLFNRSLPFFSIVVRCCCWCWWAPHCSVQNIMYFVGINKYLQKYIHCWQKVP